MPREPLFSSCGSVSGRFDAYGRQTILANNGVVAYKPSDYGQFVGFTGRYHDWETGLEYFRARYFDLALGRFIGRDPAGYVDGMSLYSGYFAPNNLDPSGEGVWEAIAKLVGKELCEDAAKALAKELIEDLLKKLKGKTPDEVRDILKALKDIGWQEMPLGKGSRAGLPLDAGGGIKLWDPISQRMLTWTPGSAHHPLDGPYWKFSSGETGVVKSLSIGIGAALFPMATEVSGNPNTGTGTIITAVALDVVTIPLPATFDSHGGVGTWFGDILDWAVGLPSSAGAYLSNTFDGTSSWGYGGL